MVGSWVHISPPNQSSPLYQTVALFHQTIQIETNVTHPSLPLRLSLYASSHS